jgi:hypothetical protein
MLRDLGLDASALAGGLEGWRDAGLPVVGGRLPHERDLATRPRG